MWAAGLRKLSGDAGDAGQSAAGRIGKNGKGDADGENDGQGGRSAIELKKSLKRLERRRAKLSGD